MTTTPWLTEKTHRLADAKLKQWNLGFEIHGGKTKPLCGVNVKLPSPRTWEACSFQKNTDSSKGISGKRGNLIGEITLESFGTLGFLISRLLLPWGGFGSDGESRCHGTAFALVGQGSLGPGITPVSLGCVPPALSVCQKAGAGDLPTTGGRRHHGSSVAITLLLFANHPSLPRKRH